MRTIRNRAITLSTAALVASLALTACGSGGSGGSAGAAEGSAETAASSGQSASAGHESSAADAPTRGSTAATGGADSNQPAPADQVSSKGSNDSKGSAGTNYVTCTGSNTKVKISQVTRPINHLLLTVVNTGSKNCNAYYAPFLRFDEAQAAAQIIDESQPQAVVTLAPGEAAYASISLNGDGNPKTPAKKLTVSFPGRDNQGSVGAASAPITLPAGTRIADDTAVTYWQANMADALTW